MTEQNFHIPLLGEMFPDIEVRTTQGMMHIPQDFKGHYFVLFSHPADFTPVCTTEFVAFQKRIEEFNKLNCKLIGLSVDQVFSHIKWIEWIKEKIGVEITFPVIAANETIANKIGLLHPNGGSSTVRAVFICDTEGKVRAMIYYPSEVGRNIDEVIRALKAVKTHDENNVALPAGWPNNELIGDKVIIPPPTDIDAAKCPCEQESYDWWFKYKDLNS